MNREEATRRLALAGTALTNRESERGLKSLTFDDILNEALVKLTSEGGPKARATSINNDLQALLLQVQSVDKVLLVLFVTQSSFV